jgi:hypothetical protein
MANLYRVLILALAGMLLIPAVPSRVSLNDRQSMNEIGADIGQAARLGLCRWKFGEYRDGLFLGWTAGACPGAAYVFVMFNWGEFYWVGAGEWR